MGVYDGANAPFLVVHPARCSLLAVSLCQQWDVTWISLSAASVEGHDW